MKTDTELHQDVMNELEWEPSIRAAEIGVSVRDGVVTLSGNVDSYIERWAAQKVAARVFGVKSVVEELEVRLPGSHKRSDEDIARAASNAMEWNVSVPYNRVHVMVHDGSVTLSGEVGWWYQKDAAEDVVRHLKGVVLVSNNIAIKPAVKPPDVKDKIESAFRRNAMLDASCGNLGWRHARRVTVQARGNKVILRGTVRNWVEGAEYERAAWATPGVSEVENDIIINPLSDEEIVSGSYPQTNKGVRMTTEERKPKKEDNMTGKLQPLADRVVVKPVPKEEKTKSGIYIPDTAKERPQEGEIIAVGPGRITDDGNRIAMDLKVGDRVIYAKYGGSEIKIDDQELVIMRESDILAKKA